MYELICLLNKDNVSKLWEAKEPEIQEYEALIRISQNSGGPENYSHYTDNTWYWNVVDEPGYPVLTLI